jgi:hypothetical protein
MKPPPPPFRWTPPRTEPPPLIDIGHRRCFIRRTYTGPETFHDALAFDGDTATERHALSVWHPGKATIITNRP